MLWPEFKRCCHDQGSSGSVCGWGGFRGQCSLPNRIQGVAQSVKETNGTPAEALKPQKCMLHPGQAKAPEGDTDFSERLEEPTIQSNCTRWNRKAGHRLRAIPFSSPPQVQERSLMMGEKISPATSGPRNLPSSLWRERQATLPKA